MDTKDTKAETDHIFVSFVSFVLIQRRNIESKTDLAIQKLGECVRDDAVSGFVEVRFVGKVDVLAGAHASRQRLGRVEEANPGLVA